MRRGLRGARLENPTQIGDDDSGEDLRAHLAATIGTARTFIRNVVARAEETDDAERAEERKTGKSDPNGDDDSGEDLHAHLAATIETAFAANTVIRISEEAQCGQAPEAWGIVYSKGIHDIVNPQPLEQHRCTLVDESADSTDDQSLPWLYRTAASGNSDETCQDAVAEASNVKALRFDRKRPQGEHDDACDAGRKVRPQKPGAPCTDH